MGMRNRDLVAEYAADPARFGRLVPVQWIGRKGHETIWQFRCSCGTLTEMSIDKVRPGCTQSCGCLKREKDIARLAPYIGHNTLPVAVSATNIIYRRYRQHAEERGLIFNLTLDQFGFLITQPCYIPNCGKVNSNRQRVGQRNEWFEYNGIDRIDNDRGYVDGNVAPCCRTCNFAKRAMGLHEFYTWISLLREGHHGI
jgi:hypothetical protein